MADVVVELCAELEAERRRVADAIESLQQLKADVDAAIEQLDCDDGDPDRVHVLLAENDVLQAARLIPDEWLAPISRLPPPETPRGLQAFALALRALRRLEQCDEREGRPDGNQAL